jgi:hypothetical protein
MTRFRSIAVLLGAAALIACEKNAVQDITGPAPAARIKFFNFGLGAPNVNFYANDTKVTAVNSATGTEATTGVAFGGVGAGGYYTGIEPGQYTFSGRISATVDKDLAISELPFTIQDGKFYSLYLSGPYNTTTKTVDSFIIEDNFRQEIDFTVAQVRFVNAMHNADPMTLSATHSVTGVVEAINGPVAYKGSTDFIEIPPGSYNLRTRYTGSATNVIIRDAVGFSPGRAYTITARGDITVVSTTAANRPFLDNTVNR